jgi:phospholipase C
MGRSLARETRNRLCDTRYFSNRSILRSLRCAGHAVRHVVIIVKENRTFDHMFGRYPGANGATSGKISSGKTISLAHATDREPDISHTFANAKRAINNGLMNRFDQGIGCGAPKYACYSQYAQADIPHYWTYAQNYVSADNFFSSLSGPSFPNHQYLIASQSGLAISNPKGGTNHSWGCDAGPAATVQLLGGGNAPPCFDYDTLGDRLSAAGLSWQYFAPGFNTPGYQWSAYDAINHIRNTRGRGEAWTVAQINSIMASPDWPSTVIFVTWDDFGGFYDHAPPSNVDSLGFGPRVPLLIISPFVTRGQVCHTQGSFDSLLAFVEYNWSLSAITARDAAADPLLSCFNFKGHAPAMALSE